MTPPPTEWDQMVSDVLRLLAERRIRDEQAESWLWLLVEFAEATYA